MSIANFEFLGLKMLQKDIRGKKVQTMAMMMLMTSYQRVRKVSELITQQFTVPGSNERLSTLIHGRKKILIFIVSLAGQLGLISLAHLTTKFPFSLAQKQNLLALGKRQRKFILT